MAIRNYGSIRNRTQQVQPPPDLSQPGVVDAPPQSPGSRMAQYGAGDVSEAAPQDPAQAGPPVDPGAQPPGGLPPTSAPLSSYGPPPTATSAQFQPNTQTGDINRMWRDNRTAALDQGNAINSDLVNQQNYRGGLESKYRGAADTAYNDLSQTPGYTADESSNIVRNDQFNNLLSPQSRFDALNPNDQERAAITGDPNAPRDPGLQRQIDSNSANMQRGAVQATTQNIGNTLGKEEAANSAAIDGDKLGLSSDFYQNTGGALASGNAAVRGTINSSKLRYDPAVAAASKFSDQDVQDWQDQAARTVQSRYAGAKDDLTRAAAASGNAGPLAVAAGRARLESQSAAGAADAATDARIQGRQAQTQRNMDLEQSRIGAEQGYSGLASSNEQSLAARGLTQANTDETMRQAAERDISDRRMSAANTEASHGLQGATTAGGLATGVEQGIGSQEAGTQRYVTDTGMAADTSASGRAATLYNARNTAGRYGIDTAYGQGADVQKTLSAGNTQVANTRIGGQQEYRGYLGNQTQQAQQAGQAATGQRIQNYGTQMGATDQATSGLSGWEIGNQGNTVLNKSLNTIGTLSGAARATAGLKSAWG